MPPAAESASSRRQTETAAQAAIERSTAVYSWSICFSWRTLLWVSVLLILVLRQTLDLKDRANLDGAQARSRNLSGNADCLIQVPGVNQEIATELLTGLRKRTVGDELLAIPH